MRDLGLRDERGPTMMIRAIATRMARGEDVVPPAGGVVADEERHRVVAEGDGAPSSRRSGSPHVPEPRGDSDEAAVSESLDEVRDQPSRGRIADAELDADVADQAATMPARRNEIQRRSPRSRLPRRAARRCRRRSSRRYRAGQRRERSTATGWTSRARERGRRVAAEEELDDREANDRRHDPATWSGSWKEWSTTRLPRVVVPVLSASAAAICVPLAGRNSTPTTAVHMAIM